MRTTSILLLCLLGLAFAPVASASDCTSYRLDLATPTGQTANANTYSCSWGSYESRDGGVYVEDEVTGETVYAYGYENEQTTSGGNATSSHHHEGFGAGTYNTQGNLLPYVWVHRASGSSSYDGSTYEWEYGAASVSWGPFSQNVRFPVLP